ncbi:MAG: triacylglycerol lipase [Spirulinaceae cyanobacterium]
MPAPVNRNPVLLVHGINDTVAVFNSMSAYLTKLGWSVYKLNLTPNNGDLGLDKLAMQVAAYIEANFPPQQPLDLVGFSMGGIVTRYYLQRLGGIKRVQRYISISAPNHGTIIAQLSQRPGCIQMRPHSSLLKDLNHDAKEMLGRVDYTTIWTPFDLMIVPAGSSVMGVGKEVKLNVLLHPWMLTDYRCLKIVGNALSSEL